VDCVLQPAQTYETGILARSPLKHGALAFLKDKIDTLPDTEFRKKMFAGHHRQTLQAHLQQIYQRWPMPSERLPYFAIACVGRQTGITSVVTGMTTPDQVRANANPENYLFDSLPGWQELAAFQWRLD
jgi:aryl-alcohol dehydrogenase-like predicted oxidoreductase